MKSMPQQIKQKLIRIQDLYHKIDVLISDVDDLLIKYGIDLDTFYDDVEELLILCNGSCTNNDDFLGLLNVIEKEFLQSVNNNNDDI